MLVYQRVIGIDPYPSPGDYGSSSNPWHWPLKGDADDFIPGAGPVRKIPLVNDCHMIAIVIASYSNIGI